VNHILHAGDICARSVLETLAQVAPVTAVRGNRDILAGPLNMVEELELGGVRIALMHGHGSPSNYAWDKFQFMLFGYRFERYLRTLSRVSPSVRAVVFGHTHHPQNSILNGRLLFNPGSSSFGPCPGDLPAIGLLQISKNAQVRAETVRLEGWQVVNRRWVQMHATSVKGSIK
jgi:putative phosphoesterase